MSAYATAMTEAPHDDLLAEVLRQQRRAQVAERLLEGAVKTFEVILAFQDQEDMTDSQFADRVLVLVGTALHQSRL